MQNKITQNKDIIIFYYIITWSLYCNNYSMRKRTIIILRNRCIFCLIREEKVIHVELKIFKNIL